MALSSKGEDARQPARAESRMDHAYVDDQQIAERYLLGKLSGEERDRFEEHFLGCRECVERLELAAILQQGTRQLAGRHAAATSLGILAALARLGRSRRAALAAMALLAAVLLPALLALRVGRLDREVDRLQVEVERREAGEQRGAPGAAARESALRDQLAAARGQLAQERERAHTEVEAARDERAALAAQLEQARRPQPNTPVAILGAERFAGGEPSARIALPPPAGWILFSIELDGPAYPGYRATLLGADGAALWQGSGLVLDAQGNLTVLLPAERLAPGDFAFRVEGVPEDGRPVPAGRFPFRVVR